LAFASEPVSRGTTRFGSSINSFVSLVPKLPIEIRFFYLRFKGGAEVQTEMRWRRWRCS
jgi:hypothetical protein